VYDDYFTGNQRDKLRSEERKKVNMTDKEMIRKFATEDGMYVQNRIEEALKLKKNLNRKEEREMIRKRLNDQSKSRAERITGFLKAAGVDQQFDKDESRAENKTEPLTEAAEESALSDEKEAQKRKNQNRVSELNPDAREEMLEDRNSFAFMGLVKQEERARVDFFSTKITNKFLIHPNLNAWSQVLLLTQNAPDDITPRDVPYSELDATTVHKMLELAVDLKSPHLLALSEKACGMYAHPLSYDLRSKYMAFKEDLLRNKGVSFQEMDVTDDDVKRREAEERTGWMTVPMIFIGDEFIGGADALYALERAGTLDAKLSSAP
jgi:glutaredoxin 3